MVDDTNNVKGYSDYVNIPMEYALVEQLFGVHGYIDSLELIIDKDMDDMTFSVFHLYTNIREVSKENLPRIIKMKEKSMMNVMNHIGTRFGTSNECKRYTFEGIPFNRNRFEEIKPIKIEELFPNTDITPELLKQAEEIAEKKLREFEEMVKPEKRVPEKLFDIDQAVKEFNELRENERKGVRRDESRMLDAQPDKRIIYTDMRNMRPGFTRISPNLIYMNQGAMGFGFQGRGGFMNQMLRQEIPRRTTFNDAFAMTQPLQIQPGQTMQPNGQMNRQIVGQPMFSNPRPVYGQQMVYSQPMYHSAYQTSHGLVNRANGFTQAVQHVTNQILGNLQQTSPEQLRGTGTQQDPLNLVDEEEEEVNRKE